MWLITGIFDTLVAKTSYVSSHIRSCLKLHKSTMGVTPVSFEKKDPQIWIVNYPSVWTSNTVHLHNVAW